LERCAAALPAPSCGAAACSSKRIGVIGSGGRELPFRSHRRSPPLRLGAAHRIREPQPRLRQPVVETVFLTLPTRG
jgi:hypothetical protein